MGLTDANADASEAHKESTEAAPKNLDTRAQVGLLATETAQDQRTRLAKETRPQEAVSEKAPSPFDTDLASLMTEFHIADTGSPKKNFVEVAKCLAKEVQLKYGVPQEVCLGQALLESGWGRSGGAQNHFIIFGVKSWHSDSYDRIEAKTSEFRGGAMQNETATFRGYRSIRESFDNYGAYLKEVFPEAFSFQNQPHLFLEALKSNPEHMYATDPNYVEKIISVVEKCGVTFMKTSSSPGENLPEKKTVFTTIKDFFKSGFSTVAGWMRSVGGALKDGFWAIASTFGFTPPEKPVVAAATTNAPLSTPSPSLERGRELDPRKFKIFQPEELEWPDAKVFSFPKNNNGVVTDVRRFREKHPVTGKPKMHHGDDVSASAGTAIVLNTPGVVIKSSFQQNVDKDTGKKTGAGYYVKIRLDSGDVVASFMHMEKAGPPEGSRVAAHQQIGTVGATGGATGPHLHFEIDQDGKEVDPAPYLPAPLYAQAERRTEGHVG